MREKNYSGNAEPQLRIEHGKSEKRSSGGCQDEAIFPREWYSRGYLPHCDRTGLLQSITFRLADSLPQEVLMQLELEVACVAEDRRELHRRKLIEKYMNSGLGCCALKHPAVADIVQNSFFAFDGVKYRLIAWCIMPNHVHVLIEPYFGDIIDFALKTDRGTAFEFIGFIGEGKIEGIMQYVDTIVTGVVICI